MMQRTFSEEEVKKAEELLEVLITRVEEFWGHSRGELTEAQKRMTNVVLFSMREAL